VDFSIGKGSDRIAGGNRDGAAVGIYGRSETDTVQIITKNLDPASGSFACQSRCGYSPWGQFQ
jgi:hypothetical protein